jgi:hypothetical protein
MRRARLKRRRVLPMRLRREMNAPVRFGEHLVEAGGLELAVDDEIAGVMNRRRTRLQCVTRVRHRRKFGDLDLHAIRGIFGLCRRRREYGRERFADKTHDVLR